MKISPDSGVWEERARGDLRVGIAALFVHQTKEAQAPRLCIEGWHGRSYESGDRAKPNNVSMRPLTQASLRCKRWLKPSSLHRIPTPLKRCWMSHVPALSTIPGRTSTIEI